eukprot:462224_1
MKDQLLLSNRQSKQIQSYNTMIKTKLFLLLLATASVSSTVVSGSSLRGGNSLSAIIPANHHEQDDIMPADNDNSFFSAFMRALARKKPKKSKIKITKKT